MHWLNSPTSLTSNISTQQLLTTLEDIASKVEIQSNFCIRHPDYKTLKLPDKAVSRFQQLPLNLQHKFLNSQLCNFLYSIYYNGAGQTALSLDTDPMDSTRLNNIENNTYLGVDVEFYERLHLSNKGEGYFDPGWQILIEKSDCSLAVKKGGLTLHIQRDRHLQGIEQDAIVGDLVAIKMPSNLVQNGFYMAVGNAGSQSQNSANTVIDSQLVRVYFNLNPEGAIEIMGSLTHQLNTIFIPFAFKALYNPSDYERYDTAVLYFEKSNYVAIRQVLQSVYAKHKLYFSEKVPLFTKLLAPGLALAEEPDNKFTKKESFGLNRCQIISNSLLEAWQQGNESKKNRMALIFKHFALQGIELQYPYLNYQSEDIYVTL
jgi:HopA1 effector protein family